MAAFLVAVLQIAVQVAVSSSLETVAAVTPVEKVISLLEDLKTQVETEGANEATAYEEYACFCKDMTATKSGSIKSGQDNIDLASATIAEKTATKAEKTSELTTRKATQEQLAADLENTTVRCANEQAAYEAKSADLDKALSSLKSAIKALSEAKPASFLAVRQTLDKSLAMAQTLALIKHPKKQIVAKLLQAAEGVDPLDPEYQYHSDGIIDTLNELLQDFEEEKATTDEEWGKTKKACDDTKAALTAEMSSNSAAMATLESEIETLGIDIASTREALVNAEALLKDDQVYLKDLTVQCEARANDWDQRSQLRAGELKALTEALTILGEKVSPEDVAVNKRALLQKNMKPASLGAAKPAERVPSFLQLHSNALQRRTNAGKQAADSAEAVTQRTQRAIALLRDEGRRLHSIAISSMASKVATDPENQFADTSPFAKVKTLIQKLIERLIAESTAEATKKGFCDTELGKANQDRDARWADVQTLSVELGTLEAKKAQLEADIDSLNSSVVNLQADLAEATEIRSVEKETNLDTIAKAKEGLAAVTEALTILKTFYKQAAKAKVSFAQASPVDEDTQGPGFEGAYKGNQEKSSGIIGLLEVIKSDFERTIKSTTASEKTAAADHVEFDRMSLTDISGKSTKGTLNSEDLETTINKIEQAYSDLKTNQDLLDSALMAIEELKPTCIDMTMPYEQRVQKREEEMEALKRALCILDTEQVEDECK